jgi:hypothetical protein
MSANPRGPANACLAASRQFRANDVHRPRPGASARLAGIELDIRESDGLSTLIGELVQGQQLKIYFSGNEGAWTAPLYGSKAALDLMIACMDRVTASSAATQPFTPTQPFAQAQPAPVLAYKVEPPAASPPSSAFDSGLADRTHVEEWLRSIGDGPYQSGAAYWMSVRSPP